MAEEGLVGLGVVVGAFDEYPGEDAVGDFGGGVGPDLFVSGGERERVGFYVAEDEDFVAGVIVAEKECRAVYWPHDVGIALTALRTNGGNCMLGGSS